MSALTTVEIRSLLEPYGLQPLPEQAYARVLLYLEVFAVWSRRINLSTITEPREVVQRHFGEGFALAQALPACTSLLDLGSGAGFPGLPIAIARLDTAITLAESQKKKAGFLREAIWATGLSAKVWADRAERLPQGTAFDVVTLRAVDQMPQALRVGCSLLRPGGTLAFFTGERDAINLPEGNWAEVLRVELAMSAGHIILARLG